MRYLFILSLVFLAAGCKPCKDPQTIDIGELTPQAMAMVPYTNGQVVKLRHSAGQVINFAVTRSTKTETREYRGFCDVFIFRRNTTVLFPDYPVFPIIFDITNIDATTFSFEGAVGKYFYYMPRKPEDLGAGGEIADVAVNDTVYRDVYKLKTPTWAVSEFEKIYVDSLWYNYASGVIKVIMSNGENYTIDE
jgi:hypothetical protein